jgi:hypothetical protein
LTAMVSKACLIVEDEHSFQASDKYLVAAQTDTMIYLEWPSSSLSGSTHRRLSRKYIFSFINTVEIAFIVI